MYNDKKRQALVCTGPAADGGRMNADWTDSNTVFRIFLGKAAFPAAEGTMFILTARLNILAIDIILILVLVGLVRKKNSVSGHAQSENVVPGSC